MAKNIPQKTFRVGLFFEQYSIPYPEKVGLGIIKIARRMGNWRFYMEGGLPFLSSRKMKWEGDGIITDSPDIENLRKYLSIENTPVITISDARENSPCHQVTNDDHSIGRMGAKHLMQTPERSFGFLRWGNFAFTHAREQGFAEELKKNGLSYSVLEIQQQSRHHSIQSIKKWLHSTKFPAAIMATTDDVAIFFMQICETLGVDVPRQVSVLGVNNIPLICEMFTPTLSSIQRNGEDIGIEAAKLLHRLMNGENLDYQSIKIPPVSVIQRASTSFMYSDNLEVDEAMRYIHNHANQPIAVPDVVNAVNITRRTLENRFRKHLNSSIYDKIRLAHVKYACNMLIETNIAVSRIAHESGFNDKGRLYSSFNKLMKMTPEQYRKKNTLKK